MVAEDCRNFNNVRILLLGEYSNVHATLAKGLRELGHEVTVVSNGDFWKNYPRDINLTRSYTKWGGLKYWLRLIRLLPKLRGYDVVQLINPMFLELKAARIKPVYRYLRRHNRRIFLGAFGMDYYWVSTCCRERPLRYSDFNIGNDLRTNDDALQERRDWLNTDKQRLNELIANDCDGIITGLYEYHVCYEPKFPDKTQFIPFPIVVGDKPDVCPTPPERLRLFIGINRTRSEYKGTDIMLRAAQDVQTAYPDKVELRIAENIPFGQYVEMMNGSDAILDQLYSYTPSMNPLEAMTKGIICIGGGEPENYAILGEEELRPIVNVQPTYESVRHELEQLVLHLERVPQLREESWQYVKRHHAYLKVARQYEQFYLKKH